MKHASLLMAFPAALVLAGCSSASRNRPEWEARSLLGDRVYSAVEFDEGRRAEFEANLAQAAARYDAEPDNEEAIVWYGRRLAYLGRFRDAIDVYSKGLEKNPDSLPLLRHRGHRYISVRQLNLAVKDLSKAAEFIRARGVPDEIEPDGLPNARNRPRSTLHDNVYYHLALAHYLRGEFGLAADAWGRGLERVRPNDDMLVAYTYWLYLSESRAGRADRAVARLAALPATLDIIENHAYERMLRSFQKGLAASVLADLDSMVEKGTTDAATLLYGYGAAALISGDDVGARAQWEKCLESGPWPAFGFIAAEAELARMGAVPSAAGAPPDRRTQEEQLREIQRERQKRRR